MREELFIIEKGLDDFLFDVHRWTGLMTEHLMSLPNGQGHIWLGRETIDRSDRRIKISIPLLSGSIGLIDHERLWGDNVIQFIISERERGAIEVTAKCHADAAEQHFNKMLEQWPNRRQIVPLEMAQRPRGFPKTPKGQEKWKRAFDILTDQEEEYADAGLGRPKMADRRTRLYDSMKYQVGDKTIRLILNSGRRAG